MTQPKDHKLELGVVKTILYYDKLNAKIKGTAYNVYTNRNTARLPLSSCALWSWYMAV